eukprot:tig00021434_g21366.t1
MRPVHSLLIKLLQSSPFRHIDWLSYQNSSPSSRSTVPITKRGGPLPWPPLFLRASILSTRQLFFAGAYDFGAKRNLKEYGSKEPLNFDRLYHLIDVPVDILAGEKDWLISVEDARWHYEYLSKHHPELARLRVFPKMGHMDFTLGLDDDVISSVLATLRAPQGGVAGGSQRPAVPANYAGL